MLDRVREDVLGALPEDEREVFLRALGTLACGRLAEPVPCAHPVRRRGCASILAAVGLRRPPPD